MPFRFRASLRIAPGVRLNLGRRGLFSFRRSIRLAPGVRLNLGKRGLSTSLGGRGARVTVRLRNTRATASAPGAGPVVTVVIWGARLLSGAVMIALLFSWAAGWL
jgi:Protein of unknown function (DUF4236)